MTLDYNVKQVLVMMPLLCINHIAITNITMSNTRIHSNHWKANYSPYIHNFSGIICYTLYLDSALLPWQVNRASG